MSSFLRGLLGAASAFTLSLGVAPGSAQVPPPPVSRPPADPSQAVQAPAAQPPDARQLAADLRRRYAELNRIPTRLTQNFQARTRAVGQEDVATTGTLVTYQLGPYAKTVMTNSAMARSSEAGATDRLVGAVASSFEWLRTPEGIQFRFLPEATGTAPPFTMNLTAAQLDQDPQLKALLLDPLATLRTFERLAEAGARVRIEALAGVPVFVLATRDPIELAPGMSAQLTFWISPTSMLVIRMDAAFAVTGADTGGSKTPAFVDFMSDFSYAFDVLIPPGFFVLAPVPPNAARPATVAPRAAAPMAAAPGAQPPPDAAGAQTTAPTTRVIDPMSTIKSNRDFLLR
ncbi:hypothetical protein [Methylobacterium nonmethylotrophicum]|uniref:Uncharacterized protein n=1 Tax=Methylobacterium nonmethylotrophicum TaxID=1141884 RepID=A0A4Z0NHH5_9HYPH|nr:hypothetical protein [Methylobacterium nonmethylotrophicum]TGD95124.1 hypothetical protein EU555_29550 [Methylobacterium nonmethylotrophicum]